MQRTVFKIFGVCWNTLCPEWRIGKPRGECDASFEICLGCFQMCIWKKELW